MSKLIITVEGGNVTAVYSNDPSIEVEIADYDNAECDTDAEAECVRLEAESGGMTPVY